MVEVKILYSRKGTLTAKYMANVLAEKLGSGYHISATNDASSIRTDDIVIRYGNTSSIASNMVIQSQESIRNMSDKVGMIRTFSSEHLPVTTDVSTIRTSELPMVGRNTNHRVGEQIGLILQKRDLDYSQFEYYIPYIPVKHEFRVYTFNNEVFSLSIKAPKVGKYQLPMFMRKNDDCKFIPLKMNGDSNPKFPSEINYPISASIKQAVMNKALSVASEKNITFSAMDIILDENDNVIFLEANSAFGLINQEEISREEYDAIMEEKPYKVVEKDGSYFKITTAKRFSKFIGLLKDEVERVQLPSTLSTEQIEEENEVVEYTENDFMNILNSLGV